MPEQVKAPVKGVKRIDSTYRGKPTHRYTIDGRKAPGVTTILDKGLPKPALVGWGIKSVAEYAANNLDTLVEMQGMGRAAIVAALKQSPYAQRDAAANRGTEVHAIAEKLIHGQEVDVPEEIAGYVESYVQFLDDWNPVPVLVEAVVANRAVWYVGTLDGVFDIPGLGRVLIDVKTSRGVYGSTAYQLAAYRHAEVYLDADGVEQPMPEVVGGYIVHVRADGYSLIPAPCGPEEFKTFRHIGVVHRAMENEKELLGQPLDPPSKENAA